MCLSSQVPILAHGRISATENRHICVNGQEALIYGLSARKRPPQKGERQYVLVVTGANTGTWSDFSD